MGVSPKYALATKTPPLKIPAPSKPHDVVSISANPRAAETYALTRYVGFEEVPAGSGHCDLSSVDAQEESRLAVFALRSVNRDVHGVGDGASIFKVEVVVLRGDAPDIARGSATAQPSVPGGACSSVPARTSRSTKVLPVGPTTEVALGVQRASVLRHTGHPVFAMRATPMSRH